MSNFISLLGILETNTDIANITQLNAGSINVSTSILNSGTIQTVGSALFKDNVTIAGNTQIGGNLDVGGSINMKSTSIENLKVTESTTLSYLSSGYLKCDGSGLVFSENEINLGSDVVNILPITNDGTGTASISSGYVKSNGSILSSVSTIQNTDISGLGTISTQNFDNVYITGGDVLYLNHMSSVETQCKDAFITNINANVATHILNVGNVLDTVNLYGNSRFVQGSYTLSPPSLVSNATIATTTDLSNYLLKSSNLSDVASTSTARTNLGLGSLSVQNSNSISVSNGNITATLNANANKITNCSDPTNAQDVATKNYVDTHTVLGSFVKRDGSTPLTAGWWAGNYPASFNGVEVGSATNRITGLSTIINTGTLTLPTSTDTLVGRATTDTLSNKTLNGPIVATNSMAYNLGTSGGGTFHYQMQNSGSVRYAHGLSGSESGSNAGSNYTIWRYSDGGSYLGTVLQSERSTGDLSLGFTVGGTPVLKSKTDMTIEIRDPYNLNIVNPITTPQTTGSTELVKTVSGCVNMNDGTILSYGSMANSFNTSWSISGKIKINVPNVFHGFPVVTCNVFTPDANAIIVNQIYGYGGGSSAYAEVVTFYSDTGFYTGSYGGKDVYLMFSFTGV